MEGVEVCRQIRLQSQVMVLMLTARDSVADRVHGLESGADDYLVKPFATEELLARIRTLLRRRQPDGPRLLVCGDLALDPGAHLVRRSDREIEMTAQEFRLLEYMLTNRDQVLSRSQILTEVWGLDGETTSNLVDVYVRYLRQKLGVPDLVQTVRGFGYVLRAP